MPRTSIPRLSTLAVTFRLSSPPQNVAQSRQILKSLQKFGQVTSFKALRFPSDLSSFTPTVHVLFTSPDAVSRVKAAMPLIVSGLGTTLTVVDDYGKWSGREHEDYLVRTEMIVPEDEGGRERRMAVRATGGGFGIGARKKEENVAWKGFKGEGWAEM